MNTGYNDPMFTKILPPKVRQYHEYGVNITLYSPPCKSIIVKCLRQTNLDSDKLLQNRPW